MLRSLRVRQFKSLRDVELPLSPLTVLVGPNAAGKSNLLDALRLLQDGLREDMRTAVKRRGDCAVLFLGERLDELPNGFETEVDCELPHHVVSTFLRYRYRYDWDYVGGEISEEALTRHKKKSGAVVSSILEAHHGQVAATITSADGSHGTGGLDLVGQGLLGLKAVSYWDDCEEARDLRLYIESWRFLIPEVAAIRAPRRSSREDVLEPSAGNLANVLRTLDESKSEALPRIIEDLKTLLGFVEDLRTETERGQVSLLLREKGRATDLESLHLSDGTLRLLAMLTALHTLPSPGLLCIEEPEHGLHPSLLGPLIGALRSVCGPRSHRQVVLTTHSADLVDCLEPSELRPIERGEVGDTVLRTLDKRQHVRWLKDFRLGQLWRMRRIGGVS